MMDILNLLYLKEITLKEAEMALDNIVKQAHQEAEGRPDWQLKAGFSEFEATAYAQGAFLSDISKFRYDGWPTSCCVCNLPLDHTKYGWWFSYEENGQPCLKHLQCPVLP
jgi:hypothetical protein